MFYNINKKYQKVGLNTGANIMREIKNNIEIAKMQNPGLKQDKSQNAEASFDSVNEEPGVKDFSNPTEVLGRSQVGKTDNLQNDFSFAISNPKKIENSDKLFELAYKNLMSQGDPNAYEKACSIATSSAAIDLL